MADHPPYLSRAGDDVLVDAVVQPRSAKDALVGLQGRALKLKVTAPPVDGKANEALIDFLARHFRVPRRHVHIVSGLRSRRKRVQITAPVSAGT